MRKQRPQSNQTGNTISAPQQWCPPVADRRQQPSSARLGKSQAGFTIVELMIATVVFSLVLMVIIFGVIHFTNGFYRGINSSATQTATQNAIDTISQAIQFSNSGNGKPSQIDAGNDGHFCAGSKTFIYTQGVRWDGTTPGTGNWGLYVLNAVTPACSIPAITTGGTELLSSKMRLAYVSVTNPSANLWNVSIKIAFGDSDLLCNTDKNGDPSGGGCLKGDGANAIGSIVQGGDVRCKLTTGSQFCSVSQLSTAARQRISTGG